MSCPHLASSGNIIVCKREGERERGRKRDRDVPLMGPKSATGMNVFLFRWPIITNEATIK